MFIEKISDLTITSSQNNVFIIFSCKDVIISLLASSIKIIQPLYNGDPRYCILQIREKAHPEQLPLLEITCTDEKTLYDLFWNIHSKLDSILKK